MMADVFIIIALIAGATFVNSSPVYIEVEQGALLGRSVQFVENKFLNITRKINVFKGVPYAEPPVRFRPPEPKTGWDEFWNATTFRGTCAQFAAPTIYLEELDITEDCLYLNIYAPKKTERLLPVMVFIHGGGYMSGTSMQEDTNGTPMAAIGNVVVVTINYRLGIFGFLDTGDAASTGNFGLLDQAEALRWIQRNIQGFGGNSAKVTIFGESAGAGSVHFHMLSEDSRDLFHQAILQSGTATTSWSFREDKENRKVETAFKIGNEAGCSTDDTQELVDCLRQVDMRQLLWAAASSGYLQGQPTIDGVFLKESPLKLLERGDFKKCPIMMGFNGDEGTLFMLTMLFESALLDRPMINQTQFKRLLRASLLDNNQDAHSLIENAVTQQYMDWSEADNKEYDYFDVVSDLNGDETFSCPAMKVARTHATMTSQPVFLYHMTHVPTASVTTAGQLIIRWLGAGHGEELRFVFGYSFIGGIDEFRGPMTDEEIELSVDFIRFWTNFAKSGDPSRSDTSFPPGEGSLTWPPFTVPELQYKELSLNMNVARGLKARECAFWNNFKPQLEHYLASFDRSEVQWRDEFYDWQDDLKEWRKAFKDFQKGNSCS